ncbi:MAG TPA: hypothetical protein VM241_00520 [Candidatus Thermoplasmatota archaeon]|nr:hypothetical protein [Candidatus Thermoplasmatota archaeon]
MADMRGKRNRTRLFGDLADYVEWVRHEGSGAEIVGLIATGLSGHDILVTYRELAPDGEAASHREMAAQPLR